MTRPSSQPTPDLRGVQQLFETGISFNCKFSEFSREKKNYSIREKNNKRKKHKRHRPKTMLHAVVVLSQHASR